MQSHIVPVSATRLFSNVSVPYLLAVFAPPSPSSAAYGVVLIHPVCTHSMHYSRDHPWVVLSFSVSMSYISYTVSSVQLSNTVELALQQPQSNSNCRGHLILRCLTGGHDDADNLTGSKSHLVLVSSHPGETYH